MENTQYVLPLSLSLTHTHHTHSQTSKCENVWCLRCPPTAQATFQNEMFQSFPVNIHISFHLLRSASMSDLSRHPSGMLFLLPRHRHHLSKWNDYIFSSVDDIVFTSGVSVCVCVWYNSAVFLQSFLVIWCLMYISVCTHLKHVLEILYFLCVVFRQQSIRAERENKHADKLICAGFQLKLQVRKLWFVV